MKIGTYEKAKAIRDRIDDLKQNVADLHSNRIWQIVLDDGTELKEMERGKIKKLMIDYYESKIEELEKRFDEV